MYLPNVDRILSLLQSSDIVLDIGGWACPFNRANFVMDAESYETRGYYRNLGWPASQGGEKEHFSKETWIQRDICSHEPYPFHDKEIDFVICSHTLEDIRDPLWVCAEMIRIAKRGYIEVPSRERESCRNGRSHVVGLSHHRWLIEFEGDRIRFMQKYHAIHSHWRFSFSTANLKRIPMERTVQWLSWEDSFQFEEKTIHGAEAIEAELAEYIQRVCPYPRWRLSIDTCTRRVQAFGDKVKRHVSTLFP